MTHLLKSQISDQLCSANKALGHFKGTSVHGLASEGGVIQLYLALMASLVFLYSTGRPFVGL